MDITFDYQTISDNNSLFTALLFEGDLFLHLPYTFYLYNADNIAIVEKIGKEYKFKLTTLIQTSRDNILKEKDTFINNLESYSDATKFLLDLNRKLVISYYKKDGSYLYHPNLFSKIPPTEKTGSFILRSEQDNKLYKIYKRTSWNLVVYMAKCIKEYQLDCSNIIKRVNENSISLILQMLAKKHSFFICKSDVDNFYYTTLVKMLQSPYMKEKSIAPFPYLEEKSLEKLNKTIQKSLFKLESTNEKEDIIEGKEKIYLSKVLKNGLDPHWRFEKVQIDINVGKDIEEMWVSNSSLYVYISTGILDVKNYEENYDLYLADLKKRLNFEKVTLIESNDDPDVDTLALLM